jgi:hypothetical protein
MGLFKRNNELEIPVDREEELIAKTMMLNNTFKLAEKELEDGYAASIASYSKSIYKLSDMIIGDLIINAYQRTGTVVSKSDITNKYVTKVESPLTLAFVSNLVNTELDYDILCTEVFEANDIATEDVIDEIRSRVELLKSYIRLVESALVIDQSGFSIKNNPNSLTSETESYGRYV